MQPFLRPMKEEEYPLLSDFLYEAIFVPAGVAAPPRSVLSCPELQVYIAHFGTGLDDHCFVAEQDGALLGAVWVFFVKYFSLKKASKFPFFSKGFSLPSAGIMHPCA